MVNDEPMERGLPRGTTPKKVIAAACSVSNLSMDRLLRSKKRKRWPNLVLWRAACAWILRERLGLSLPEIGAALLYDHTTVLHHLRTTCTRASTIDAVRLIEDKLRRTADEETSQRIAALPEDLKAAFKPVDPA